MRRAGAAAVVLALLAPPALAYHDERPATDPSAYTLKQAEFRLGLWRFEAGVTDDILLGTYPLMWLLRLKNLHAKWAFLREGDFTLAASTGILALNLKDFGDDQPDLKFFVFPIFLVGSYDLGDIRLHLGAGYTHVSTSGQAGEGDEGDVEGFAALSTAQIVPTVELHVDRVFAILIESHISLFQSVSGEGGSSFTLKEPPELADRTTIETFASADADLATGFQGNVMVSAHWSIESFNLRLGAGYGHFTVPMVNLFAGAATPLIDFAMYWRFGA